MEYCKRYTYGSLDWRDVRMLARNRQRFDIYSYDLGSSGAPVIQVLGKGLH